MAKKQQIILTHGSNRPSDDVIKSLKLGELLVQHATAKTETALHTVISEGDNAVLVSFPSEDWVTKQISDLNVSDINQNIESLGNLIAGVREDFEQEDLSIRNDINTTKNEITSAYTQTIDALELSLQGQIDDLSASDDSINQTLNEHGNLINEKYNQATSYTENRISEVTSLITANTESIDTLTSSKLDKTTFEEYEESMGTELQGIKDSISSLDDTYVTDAEFTEEKAAIMSAITEAKTTIATATTASNEAGINVTLKSSNPNVYEITGVNLVSKLELEAVEDKAQSALDSIDAILNGSGSTEAIDTLKDVIVWINDHEDVKTSILTAITEHTEILSGFTKTSTVKATTDALQASIESLEDSIDGIDDSIEALQGKDENLELRMAAAETGITANASAITNIDVAYKNADKELKDELLAKIQSNTDAFSNYYNKSEIDIKVNSLTGDTAEIREIISANELTIAASFNAINETLSAQAAELSNKVDTTTFESLSEQVSEIEANYINSIEVENTDDNKITATLSEDGHSVKLNFDEMIIDGGSYEN